MPLGEPEPGDRSGQETGAADIELDGPNHRGYPTMQLYKRPGG